ncbi:30S ribosomal protein S21 [Mariniflexile maritimum]|jgi:small subunit ribosomal protein S21|uniref:30S ribosomal protein S21 n=1 Tax=Mariniflexile maritimum TaxID=2682493 RepID=UPI0012F6A14C|nr:30S ribosomal protein S21 [Mariniflexile maritimum]MCB0449781.1 30S ribosomal protein S21 [Confluentibacter sp.]
MLKIIIKEGENIERALKRYKRKHRNIKVMQNLRDAQFFTKPSVKRRRQIQKAQYIQTMRDQEDI